MSKSVLEQEKQLHNNPDNLPRDNNVTSSTDHVKFPADHETSSTVHDLSSDDDDDLIVFSNMPSARNVPHYLREAMSGTVTNMSGFHTYLLYPVYPLYSVTISFQTS